MKEPRDESMLCCTVCGTVANPPHTVNGKVRCNACLYFGTSGPAPKDKPARGESLTAWLARTGRKRPSLGGSP